MTDRKFKAKSAIQGAAYLDEKILNLHSSGVTHVTDVTINEHAASGGSVTKDANVTGATRSKILGKDKCPVFICFDEWTEESEVKLPDDVWFYEVSKEGR